MSKFGYFSGAFYTYTEVLLQICAATTPFMPHELCDHDHHHGHSHGIGNSHAPANFGRAFAIGIALNILFVVVEAAFGGIAHSLALLADAGHNLSDVFGLLLAWGAFALSARRPTERRTYGMRRSSILAALFNAKFL
jgi:cobalt-zinc-cadmium efflux system protein